MKKKRQDDDPLQTLTPDEVAELLCCAVERGSAGRDRAVADRARGKRKRYCRIRRAAMQKWIEASEKKN